jgi:hypothetical protein
MKLERKCTCGSLLTYTRKHTYERAERENRLCLNCSRKKGSKFDRSEVGMLKMIEFYISETIRQKTKDFQKLDKSTWSREIAKAPFKVWDGKDGRPKFLSSMVSGKKRDIDYLTLEQHIDFYKSEIKTQNKSFQSLDSSNWPDNISKCPHHVFDDWSLTKLGLSFVEYNREEIARLVISYIDIIDNLDDMMIAILLSKISDKEKISNLVSKKVTKLIKKIVEENEQGNRKEALEKLSQDIIDNSVDIDDVSDDLDITDDVSDDLDIIDVDDTPDEVKKDEISYQDKLKRRINIMEKAILNDDVDVDYKKLLQDNALKLMWYLEVSK